MCFVLFTSLPDCSRLNSSYLDTRNVRSELPKLLQQSPLSPSVLLGTRSCGVYGTTPLSYSSDRAIRDGQKIRSETDLETEKPMSSLVAPLTSPSTSPSSSASSSASLSATASTSTSPTSSSASSATSTSSSHDSSFSVLRHDDQDFVEVVLPGEAPYPRLTLLVARMSGVKVWPFYDCNGAVPIMPEVSVIKRGI